MDFQIFLRVICTLALCHSLAHSDIDPLIILQDITQFHYIEAIMLIKSGKMEITGLLDFLVIHIYPVRVGYES